MDRDTVSVAPVAARQSDADGRSQRFGIAARSLQIFAFGPDPATVFPFGQNARFDRNADRSALTGVEHHALEALTALSAAAAPARSAIEEASRDDQDYVRNAGRYLLAVVDGRFDPHKTLFELDRLMANANQPV